MTESAPVLFVCTGNIARSAYAAQRWNDAIAAIGLDPVACATSAGTTAQPGERSTDDMVAAASATGTSLDSHQAQPLVPSLVQDATLVLGATRAHRGAAIRLHPRANRYSFAMVEFSRLATTLTSDDLPDDFESLGADRFAAFVRTVASRRGFVPPPRSDADDVADPHGRGRQAHARAVEQIDEAVVSIVASLDRCFAGVAA